jgi:hypothetical protein
MDSVEYRSCRAEIRAISLSRCYWESGLVAPELFTKEELSPFTCSCPEEVRSECKYGFTAED